MTTGVLAVIVFGTVFAISRLWRLSGQGQRRSDVDDGGLGYLAAPDFGSSWSDSGSTDSGSFDSGCDSGGDSGGGGDAGCSDGGSSGSD